MSCVRSYVRLASLTFLDVSQRVHKHPVLSSDHMSSDNKIDLANAASLPIEGDSTLTYLPTI